MNVSIVCLSCSFWDSFPVMRISSVNPNEQYKQLKAQQNVEFNYPQYDNLKTCTSSAKNVPNISNKCKLNSANLSSQFWDSDIHIDKDRMSTWYWACKINHRIQYTTGVLSLSSTLYVTFVVELKSLHSLLTAGAHVTDSLCSCTTSSGLGFFTLANCFGTFA